MYSYPGRFRETYLKLQIVGNISVLMYVPILELTIMDIFSLLNEEGLVNDNSRAVSPVIGVILMVAITVILAAVIGAFVLGLGDQVQQTSPSASFSFDWESGAEVLTITHEGGHSIPTDELYVVYDGNEEPWVNGDTVRAGDSFSPTSPGPTTDQTVRVVWRSEGDQQSATLARFTVP